MTDQDEQNLDSMFFRNINCIYRIETMKYEGEPTINKDHKRQLQSNESAFLNQ
jgi:hypothetical protein